MTSQPKPNYDTLVQKVSQARYILNRECPFLANLVNRVPVRISEGVQTACVVNRGEMGEMWLGPDFFGGLSVGETAFVLAHEVMHLAYGVFPRFSALGPMADMGVFNQAHDYVINGQLQELTIAFPASGMAIPTGDKAPLLDRRLSDGKSAEALYGELLKKKQSAPKPQNGSGSGPGSSPNGQGKPSQGQGQDGDPKPGEGEGEGEGKSKDGENPPTPGGGGKGFSDATDVVMEPGSGDEGKAQGDADTQARRWQNALAEAVAAHEAWKQSAPGRGNLPGSVTEAIKEILRPEINWIERVFQMADGHLRGGGVSYSRLSKRGIALDTMLPGRGRRRPRLGFVLDTSGSMSSAELGLMAGVGLEIANSYEAECRMIHVDAGVNMDEEVDDLASYFQAGFVAKGRGGTVFEPAVEALKNDGEPVDLVILCTDGGVAWPDHDSWPCPVFVVSTGELPPAPYQGAKVTQPRRHA